MEGGLVVSDSDSDDDEPLGEKRKEVLRSKQRPKPGQYSWKKDLVASAAQPASEKKGKKTRRADTNIVSVKFDQLVSPKHMHTGDAVCCSACGAILSSLSVVEIEGPDKIWECEFCYERNKVDIDKDEVPKVDDVTFMLEPVIAKPDKDEVVSGDESLVVFCVDISGSMGQTTMVPGKLSLRGRTGKQSGYDQHRDRTSVSRLQAVQAAVDHQLEEMNKHHPNRRVALITFSSEVYAVGDGQGTPKRIDRDLENKQALMEVGRSLDLPRPIKESRKILGEKLFDLRPTNSTALGPALLISIAMAGAHVGSKVIICTDGQANIGIGKLQNMSSDEETETVQQVYEDFGNMGVEMGVMVSVISITGTDCRLSQLGRVADLTGGQVNIVDPLKLTEEFSTILADQIIATKVEATCILHKELCFLYEERVESKVVKTLGNVTYDTEITFEFAIRAALSKKDDTQKKEEVKETDSKGATSSAEKGEPEGATSSAKKERALPSKLPFQLQIRYTDKDGNKAMRVHTNIKPVTKDRQKAEQKMDTKMVASNSAYVGSKLALLGDYKQSRCRQLMAQRMVHRKVHAPSSTKEEYNLYNQAFTKVAGLENKLLKEQQVERVTFGRTHSDEEDDEHEEDEGLEYYEMVMAQKGAKSKARSREVSDDTAKILYQAKKTAKFITK
ncbi:hypothetical protein ScPMuIL_012586 [Solemya velum]